MLKLMRVSQMQKQVWSQQLLCDQKSAVCVSKYYNKTQVCLKQIVRRIIGTYVNSSSNDENFSSY